MNPNMPTSSNRKHRLLIQALTLSAAAAFASGAQADAPSYTIVDLGVIGNGEFSQAFGSSRNGSFVVGRSSDSHDQAYRWSAQGGMQALGNIDGRQFATAHGVNNAGLTVGVSATTWFGTAPLPVMWNPNGSVTALTLPEGYGWGAANAVNNSGLIVGRAGSQDGDRAVLFNAATGSSQIINATTANGSFMTEAFGVNDAGLVVGIGTDPSDLALVVGMVYNSATGEMSSLGALPGHNSAINFGVSNNGYVVGSSSLYSSDGSPFIWSASQGMKAISLPPNTSNGSGSGVNDKGWVVGNAGGEFSVPFLYADGTTYTIQSLLNNGSGWDFSTNTSASAMTIADNGSIVGTAVHNGQVHAYQMTLVSSVPEPESWVLTLGGLGWLGVVSRRRAKATPTNSPQR